MDLIQAVIYGLVQGLTEFLPISSSAHLRIVPAIFGWKDPGAAFTAVIQIGTLAAVLIYFRRELWQALRGWFLSFSKDADEETRKQGRVGWAIFIGTLPIVFFGILFKDKIEGDFRSLWVIAGTLIGLGILLFVADKLGRKERKEESVTVKDGLIIGLWQAIALVPGSSRSGSTITGALFAGFDRSSAARFSFLLSVPSIFAAAMKELWDYRKEILGEQLAPTLMATLVSFFVGYAAIAFLIRYLQTKSMAVFVVYRIALGLLLILLLSTGRLHAMAGIH